MSNHWISDLVGTLKTTFRIAKATIDAAACTSVNTPLRLSNTGIRLGDANCIDWNSQTNLFISKTADDTLTIQGAANGFTVKVANQPNNYISSNVDTLAGFRITGGTGQVTVPTYTFNGNNCGTGLFLKVDNATGATKLGIVTQPASVTTGRHVVDISLGILELLHGVAGTTAPTFNFLKSRGTSNSPTTITTGDDLGRFVGKGYCGSTFTYIDGAEIAFVSTGIISDTGSGISGEISFRTRSAGSALSEKVRIAHTGITTFLKAVKALIYTPTPLAVTFSATPTFDVSLGDPLTMTLTGNVTAATLTGGVDGQKITLRLRQDGTGSRTFTFDSSVRFGTDITGVTLSTVAGKTDYVGLIYHATDAKYDCVAFTRGY